MSARDDYPLLAWLEGSAPWPEGHSAGQDPSIAESVTGPALRCVTCRRLFAGTVTDVVANYRSHQCTPYSALFDPPHPYTNVGSKK